MRPSSFGSSPPLARPGFEAVHIFVVPSVSGVHFPSFIFQKRVCEPVEQWTAIESYQELWTTLMADRVILEMC